MIHLVSPYNFFPPYLFPYLSFCFFWFLYLSLNLSPSAFWHCFLSYKLRPHFYSSPWPITHPSLTTFSSITIFFLHSQYFPNDSFFSKNVPLHYNNLSSTSTYPLNSDSLTTKILESHVHCFYLHMLHILIIKWNKGSFSVSPPNSVSLLSLFKFFDFYFAYDSLLFPIFLVSISVTYHYPSTYI